MPKTRHGHRQQNAQRLAKPLFGQTNRAPLRIHSAQGELTLSFDLFSPIRGRVAAGMPEAPGNQLRTRLNIRTCFATLDDDEKALPHTDP